MKILNPNNIQICKDSKSSSLFVYEFEIMNACGLTVSNSSGPNSENGFELKPSNFETIYSAPKNLGYIDIRYSLNFSGRYIFFQFYVVIFNSKVFHASELISNQKREYFKNNWNMALEID